MSTWGFGKLLLDKCCLASENGGNIHDPYTVAVLENNDTPIDKKVEEERGTKWKFSSLVFSTLLKISGTFRVDLALEYIAKGSSL